MTNKIEVIGLGASDLDQLSLGIYRKLSDYKKTIFVRTKEHPVVKALEKEGVVFESFDSYYEREDQFEDVYQHIVETLLEKAQEKSIIYAVPGHPMLAEQTVQLLLGKKEIEIEIIGGQSFLDDLFTSLKIDPIEGFQFVDGTSFERNQLNYEQHIIFCQVYDRYIASEIKLALLEDLPADYLVTIIEAAGSTEETVKSIPLLELDHSLETSNLTSLYIPPVSRDLLNHTFPRLREVIATLRGPNGCEWDRSQTHETLREYFIEEVYEVIHAIDSGDDESIIEELGDVLLQVMLHSQIGEDAGYFTVEDVIRGITDKMIHRHPDVFNPSSGDITKSWDELKQIEKEDDQSSVFSDVPKSFPSLLKAYKIQKKAAKVGFDWDNTDDVWLKLDEEISEFKEAVALRDQDDIEDELGDIIFVLANLARHYKVNPELALHQTNQKFITRFEYIENKLAENGIQLTDSSFEEMDRYWDEAKRKEE
jgi:tetrapyrrole methylase family protein/MazG family protein